MKAEFRLAAERASVAIAYAEDAAGTKGLAAELSKDGGARTAVEETRDAISPLSCAGLKTSPGSGEKSI